MGWILLLTILAGSSHAADGQRRGGVVGVGLGAGSAESHFNGLRYPSPGRAAAVAGSLRLGVGVNEHYLLYLTSEAAWSEHKNVYGATHTWTHLLLGPGFTYYWTGAAPAFFLSGGLGIGYAFSDSDNGAETYEGVAGFAGAGLEFARHLHLEARYVRSDLNGDNRSDRALRTDSLRLMLQFIVY